MINLARQRKVSQKGDAPDRPKGSIMESEKPPVLTFHQTQMIRFVTFITLAVVGAVLIQFT